ncbi:hypothetical protein JTE90_008560, partial [Oedothorax gibbosus]
KVEMEAAEALLQLREQSPTLLRDGAIDLYQLPKRRKVEVEPTRPIALSTNQMIQATKEDFFNNQKTKDA